MNIETTWRKGCSIGLILSVSPVLTEPAAAGGRGKMKYPLRGRSYLSAYAGGLDGDDNSGRLRDEDSGLGTGIGGGYRKNLNLALEGDVMFFHREFDTPPIQTPLFHRAADEVNLDSVALIFSVKGVYPMSRFEPYIGAGLGLGINSLELSGSVLGIPAEAASDRKISPVYQIGVGADIVCERSWDLGLDYRIIKGDADFGVLTAGNVQIGGRFLSLTFRHHF